MLGHWKILSGGNINACIARSNRLHISFFEKAAIETYLYTKEKLMKILKKYLILIIGGIVEKYGKRKKSRIFWIVYRDELKTTIYT